MICVGSVPGAVCFCIIVSPGSGGNTKVLCSGDVAAEVGERKQLDGLSLSTHLKHLVQTNVKHHSK